MKKPKKKVRYLDFLVTLEPATIPPCAVWGQFDICWVFAAAEFMKVKFGRN